MDQDDIIFLDPVVNPVENFLYRPGDKTFYDTGFGRFERLFLEIEQLIDFKQGSFIILPIHIETGGIAFTVFFDLHVVQLIVHPEGFDPFFIAVIDAHMVVGFIDPQCGLRVERGIVGDIYIIITIFHLKFILHCEPHVVAINLDTPLVEG
jgi:hypothetical protein